jgi:hypothetical protein
MFNTTEYYKRLTNAGLPEIQARVMVKILKDVETILNQKDEELEDGHHEIQCNKLLK